MIPGRDDKDFVPEGGPAGQMPPPRKAGDAEPKAEAPKTLKEQEREQRVADAKARVGDEHAHSAADLVEAAVDQERRRIGDVLRAHANGASFGPATREMLARLADQIAPEERARPETSGA